MDHITEMFFVAGQLIMLAVLMLVSTVLALVILIFELVGLSSCKKEQIYFRSAFTACLISVPFTILRLPVFGTYAVVLFGYFEGFFHTFSYCAMIYAYGRIAEERGEIGLKRKGTFLIRLIVTVKLLNMLMGSVSQFFGTTLGNAVIIPLALVIGVLTVGQCFLIFGFLRRAGRMLDGFV